MSDEDSQISQRKRLEALRADIQAFLLTDVHRIFVENTKRDLAVIEERILDDPIDKAEDAYRLIELKGQRTVLRANTTLFEDTLSTLGDRIEQMLDEENQTRAKENTD